MKKIQQNLMPLKPFYLNFVFELGVISFYKLKS